MQPASASGSIVDRARYSIGIAMALVVALAARFSSWKQVFVDGRIYLDGPDGYYHLRRAFLILQDWPHVPQIDPWLNAPRGGLISWPPLFDFVVATAAWPWRADPRHALELTGALLPPLLGVIQVVLAAVVAFTLANRRAGLIAAFTAALLPGVVRYTLVGALDHDPFFESAVLLSVLAIARELRTSREDPRRSSIVLLSLSLTAGFLGWTGAIVQAGIVFTTAAAVAFIDRSAILRMARLVATSASLAALLIAPFAVTSIWTRTIGATFEGLSTLHLAVLVGMSLVAGAAGWSRRRSDKTLAATTLVAALASLYLVPAAVAPFLHGLLYATGHDPILSMVAEARPLLFLWGPFDPRPFLVRLTLLVLAAALVVAAGAWERRDSALAAAGVWFTLVFILALSHSRFSYSAALAGAVCTGLAMDIVLRKHSRVRTTVVAVALAITAMAAYVPFPGFSGLTFAGRVSDLRSSQLEDLLPAFETSRGESGTVLAPWYLGHWILWVGREPVVISPMLSVGQSQFRQAMHVYFETDPVRMLASLDANQVRWLIVTPDLSSLREEAGYAGAPPGLIGRAGVDPAVYLRMVCGRLALVGAGQVSHRLPPLTRFVERARTRDVVQTPFGPRPTLILYEVTRPLAAAKASS